MYYTCFSALCLGPDEGSHEPEEARRVLEESVTAFADPLGIIVDDDVHPERAILIATSWKERILFTVFIEKSDDEIRLISARIATSTERRRYEEGN